MSKPLLTFDVVREIALELTDVEAGTAYGAPAVKVNGNVLASVPVNKSAEANSAVFRIDFDLRSSLLRDKPDIYYLTDHYAGYPTVLVRLSKISRAELRELCSLSWGFVAAKKPAHAAKSGSTAKKRRR